MEVTIYQTIELREGQSDEEIVSEGPFICTADDAWLGEGYYFWDTDKSLAHAWGTSRKKFKEKYVITQAKITPQGNWFDLQGNVAHRLMFSKIIEYLIEKNPHYSIHNPPPLKAVLEAIDSQTSLRKKYQGIRLMHVQSFKSEKDVTILPNAIPVKEDGPWKIVLNKDHIQICLFQKDSLGLADYKVVYRTK